MNITNQLRATTLRLALLLAACTPQSPSPESDAGTQTPGKTLTVAQLRSLAVPALCEKVNLCGNSILESWWLSVDCEDIIGEFYDSRFAPVLTEALQKGTAMIDETHAQKMADNLRSSCDENEVYGLDSFVKGKLSTGSACNHQFECGPEGYCQHGDTCPGKCAPRLKENDTTSCRTDTECASGLKCSWLTNKCVTPLKEGALCDPDAYLCGGLTSCQPNKNGAHVCTKKADTFTVAAVGEQCGTPDTRCRQELVCDHSTSTCMPHVASGATCSLSTPDACPKGEYCKGLNFEDASVKGQCTKLPGKGEACAPYGVGPTAIPLCQPQMACVKGTCEAQKPLGAPCEGNQECQSWVCARPATCALNTTCNDPGTCVLPTACKQ